jgi:hypothetical protein
MRLGEGRSGVVFRTADAQGLPRARKVFDSDALTKAVQYFFLGAPNPYAWNEHAVQCALLRRRILAPLVEHWFGRELRVARALGQDWNEEFRAYQLWAEFVEGRPLRLHRPFDRRGRDDLRELQERILKPLQAHLAEAGFDGMVWQAGRGNPVALGNFLREGGGEGAGPARWAWIDLESGVPALFPLGVHHLFKFYLPCSWRLKRPLFDDVDLPRLRAWLREQRAALVRSLGEDELPQVISDVEALAYHQDEWKNQPRHRRSIAYQLRKGSIDVRAAGWYARHPARWYAFEARRLVSKGLAAVARGSTRCLSSLRRFPWRRFFRGAVHYTWSQAYRLELAQRFVAHRIDSWQRREQLEPHEAAALRARLTHEESCSWLTDFGVHVAVKPFVKAAEIFVLPALYAGGLIDEATLGVGLLMGGSIVRTLYTLARAAQATLTGHERPWIALGVGTLPVLGNLAYPIQIAWTGAGREEPLAQFILYDGCAVLGGKLPIWGGRDTLTEHATNHLPDLVLGLAAGSRRTGAPK